MSRRSSTTAILRPDLGNAALTAAIDRVEFKAPVLIGDVVSFYGRTVREGTTSVTVAIDVQAERHDTGAVVGVTSAQLVMVCVDRAGTPVPWRSAGVAQGG
jgi:acyl-CoA thioesterase YciA